MICESIIVWFFIMKQIYEHNEGLDELAYKLDVRVYKEAQITIDYQ